LPNASPFLTFEKGLALMVDREGFAINTVSISQLEDRLSVYLNRVAFGHERIIAVSHLQTTDPLINSDVRSELQLKPPFTVYIHNDDDAENL
jgi:hypothetical protein